MNSTTISIPIDLFEKGFASAEDLNMTDIPVSYNARMFPVITFIERHFQKGDEINRSANSQWLAQIYRNGTGGQITNGQMTAAMIISGFKYERNGLNGLFNISPASVTAAVEKTMVTMVEQLPKNQLHFPGTKRFNSLPLEQRSSILRDFLKLHHYPTPYVPAYLLNRGDKMAIRFTVNAQAKIIQAEALSYMDAIRTLELDEATLESPAVKAF